MTTIHLIPNSHLDPVWLWDWREGLNEGITTCRTMLDILEDFPELTYIRGESAIYSHIQKHSPATFSRIRDMIESGRWDVVGGTLIQPDTNLPATECLTRQFTTGLNYFRSELGVRPTVAWAADSFGHCAGLPEILAAAGMNSYAFSRPMEHDYHLSKPAFWWKSASGKKILCWRIPVGWYGTNRDEVPRRMDAMAENTEKWGLDNVAVFIGLGNHGGGPSRRNIEDLIAWGGKHPEFQVSFSTLHRFFDALRSEASELQVVEGELNFTLRGCYSSAARFKTLYRKAENTLLSAEKTASIVALAAKGPAVDLSPAWNSMLFNAFHDILPGSSVERAFDDQMAWTGSIIYQAQDAELTALNSLADQIDTSVEMPADDMPCAVPIVLWNPHPYEYIGPIEVEAALDYRPIDTYVNRVDELPVEVLDDTGDPIAFQKVETENEFSPTVPWRVRIVAQVRIPALGWKQISMAWKETPRLAPPVRHGSNSASAFSISNGSLTIEATPGETEINLSSRSGKHWIRVATYEDPYGSWGGHDGEREADAVNAVKHLWKVQQVEVLERGPERAALWVQMTDDKSRLELTLHLNRGSDRLDASARLFCDCAGHRIKLLMPAAEQVNYEVPGGQAHRGAVGEVPGGRWVNTGKLLFASDAIYNFSVLKGTLGATLVRSTRHACSVPVTPGVKPWKSYMDLGEHRFRFALAPAASSLDPYQFADSIEQPIVAMPTAPHKGARPKAGSLAALQPSNIRLLALKPSELGDGWIVRIQETAGTSCVATLILNAHNLTLGEVDKHEIASWKLIEDAEGWLVLRVAADEEEIQMELEAAESVGELSGSAQTSSFFSS